MQIKRSHLTMTTLRETDKDVEALSIWLKTQMKANLQTLPKFKFLKSIH